MKILESWARGVPVITTPEAAKGLDAKDGVNLLVADSVAEFAAAVSRTGENGGLRDSMVVAGRTTLRRHHDPRLVGDMLLDAYDAAITDSMVSIGPRS